MRGCQLVTIRPAVPEDFAAIKTLTCAAYVASGHVEPDSPYTQELADILSRAEGLYVAEHNGVIMGSVNIAPPGSDMAQVAGPRELEFRMLAVHPQHQGHGVGRALVQYILDMAATAKLDGVAITTMPSMKGAQAMYHAMGFHRAPERDWNLYTAGIVDHEEGLETYLVYVHNLNTSTEVKEIHG